ncbi:FHA domain-containing protein [Nocardioides cynanchi]|uniref:FHA domain-containing protein n=1 Tax=Nocardioides cynanchi TaxID=2558918 RepID=UPI0012456B99|nr:FHA domain-containing protein [Nocardioides cynanchi]
MTASRSVTPGDWYGVLGDRVAVLLPPAAKSRVAGLWERVDEDAGFDEVLDALISGGLRELPGFVLVSTEGSEVRVVIRGAGRAELTTSDGPVTVSGAQDTTWVEQTVSGVTGLKVQVADGDGTPYPFGTGLVRVSGLEQPPSAPASPAAAPPVTAPPVAAPPIPPPVAAPPIPPPVVTPDPGDTQSGSFDPGPLAPAEEPSPRPPDHAPGTPTPPAVAQRPVARLIFSSGEIVDVDRAVLVGRAPESRRFGGDDQSRLVRVPSPHQEVSSTHLEIRPGTGADHGSAVVTDLGSTNGTVVVQPGLPAEDLQPGIAVQLIPGAIVDLGEGVTIQVTTV